MNKKIVFCDNCLCAWLTDGINEVNLIDAPSCFVCKECKNDGRNTEYGSSCKFGIILPSEIKHASQTEI